MTESETWATTATVAILAAIFRNGEAKGKRHKQDYIADKMRVCSSEPTLLKAVEKLATQLETESGWISHNLWADFLDACNDERAPRLLRWMRDEPQLATMLAMDNDDERRARMISCVELPDAVSKVSSVANPLRKFDISIEVETLSPLAHGADTKAGNATLFRRQRVMMADGKVAELPIFSGNAFRGMMREVLADDFLEQIGLKPSRTAPCVSLPFFYMLYSGGALEEAKNDKAAKELGKNGAIRAEGLRRIRELFPALSILGCAIASRIIPGRIRVADFRPKCIEWGNGDQPSAELFDWQFLTRRERLETHEENTSMIAQSEVLKAGVSLDGGIDISSHVSEIEISALARGLRLMAENGYLGAESRRGFGKVKISFSSEIQLSDDAYLGYLKERGKDILSAMEELGFAPKKAAPVVDDEEMKKIGDIF